MKEMSARVKETFLAHLKRYEEEAERIEEGAKFWGITIQTGVRMERVLSEFYKPFPAWARWMAHRHLRRNSGDPQIKYLLLIKTINAQGMFALIQIVLFLAFLGSTFIFAAGA